MVRLLAALILLAATTVAQSTPRVVDFNQHVWASYSGDHPVAGPWGLHFDAQWRRSDLGTIWQQYQIRPGLNYKVSDNLLLTFGYVFTRSYPYGDFPVTEAWPEHRIYEQAVIRHRWASLRISHRIRMEQRFLDYAPPQPDGWTYQNRFRYQFKADIPITREGDKMKWYLPVYDEIVIGIPPNYGSRPFDQNRIFAGIGYSAAGANIEAGYLNQFLSQRNGRVFEFNNTLFLTVTSTVPLGKLFGQ